LAFALLVGVAAIAVEGTHVQPAQAAFASQLTRYPYLTDVTQGFATINWATDRSGTKGSITYGKVGTETCSAHKVSGSKTSIVVKSANEYQWKAKLTGLQPNSQYCYRVQLGTTDLLGSDPSPVFWSQIPAGNTQPYSFAVFGDWGDTDANGNNPAQAAIMNSIANSGVRFALGTGDTGYDAGTQGNYGDLYQTGYRVSSIFGPNYWTQAGDTVPFFNAVGNHGANATYFNNWPQDRVVANSGGKYAMETYCCANGAASQKSPSSWYAFDAGVARVYVLSAVWSDSNTGTSTDYGMDYAYRWQHNSAEYQWLQNDLQTHPSQLKFAVFHYPMYSDNATETSDTFLQGSNSLEGLLESNGVNMVFNGHAHLYQHNAAPPGGVVSYTSGGGGATPEPITKCKPNDTYGLGWSATFGGSSCGAGPKPTQIEQVYHYLKVDVNGYQVTVSGVNALGQTFDTATYNFSPDTTPPTAPGNLQANAPSGTRVDLTWTASTDAKGVTAYDVFRDGAGTPIATVDGDVTAFSDTTVSSNTQYSYVVEARDASNNTSDPSNTAVVTTPSSDTEAPTAPGNLLANAPNANRVDLTWTAATDNSGVIDKYDVYRNGSLNPIATVNGNLTAYSDLTVSASTAYSYTVRARDASGNTSGDSNVAQVTTPSLGVLFADDFESGSLAAWTNVTGLGVTQGVPSPSGGLWVARETSASAGGTYAYKSVSPTQTELYAKFRFQVISRTGSVDLMRFRNATGGSKLSLYVSGTSGTLSTRNAAGTSVRASGPQIVNGQWYTVEIHAKIASPTVTEVWLDGVHLTQLDAAGDIGSTAIGQFLVGTTAAGTYDVVIDDVAVAKNFIP
jgi:hypothetical protein